MPNECYCFKVKSNGRTVLHIKSWKTSDHEKKHSVLYKKKVVIAVVVVVIVVVLCTEGHEQNYNLRHRTCSGIQKRTIAIYIQNQWISSQCTQYSTLVFNEVHRIKITQTPTKTTWPKGSNGI